MRLITGRVGSCLHEHLHWSCVQRQRKQGKCLWIFQLLVFYCFPFASSCVGMSLSHTEVAEVSRLMRACDSTLLWFNHGFPCLFHKPIKSLMARPLLYSNLTPQIWIWGSDNDTVVVYILKSLYYTKYSGRIFWKNTLNMIHKTCAYKLYCVYVKTLYNWL